jgi:hypothetical protein
VLVAACASAESKARPPGASPAKVVTGTLPEGPPAPAHGLPIPSLEVEWEPPQLIAGDVNALASVLAPHRELAVFTGARMQGPLWSRRVQTLVHTLAPSSSLAETKSQGRAWFFGEDTVLPVVRVGERGPTQPPLYGANDLVVRAPARGSSGLLVDDSGLDATSWRAMPAHASGTCEPAFAALASGQEQSLAYLEAFLDHADAVLWQIHRGQLESTVGSLDALLKPYANAPQRESFTDAEAYETHVCGHAYWNWLTAARACLGTDGRCAMAPRMFLIGGARIGVAEPSGFIDGKCDDRIGTDVVEQLRELSRQTTDAAMPHLDVAWSTLADRLGAITEVHDALEDLCTPRRRRFADGDLQAARARLQKIGRALASEEITRPRGQWELADSSFFVPGVGPVFQLGRFRPGRGSEAMTVLAEARALRQFVLSRALCRSGYGDLPLVVSVLDGGDRPRFLGYFYEEELFCADLPPRVPSPSPSPAPVAPPPDAPPPPT